MDFRRKCHGDFFIQCRIFTNNQHLIAVAVDVHIDDNKELFQRFNDHKNEIEEKLKFPLDWFCKDTNKSSHIGCKKNVEEGKEEESYQWMIDKMITLRDVFNKYCD